MSIPVWPTTLPDYLLQDAYSDAFPDNILRTQMEVGPAKLRRRSTSTPRKFDGSVWLTSSQHGDLSTFYITTTLGGTLRFSWKDPVSRAVAEFRFAAVPSWTTKGAQFDVKLSLELLP